MTQYRLLTSEQSQLFSISELHSLYWKEFCDVCYSRFGFEKNEERTYEQKYETFCRCKTFVTEEKDYEQQLMRVNEGVLKRLKNLYDWFFTIDDVTDIIPALYCLVRLMATAASNLRRDINLIKYVCPRKPKVRYSEYKLDEKKAIPQTIHSPNSLNCLLSKMDHDMLKELKIIAAFPPDDELLDEDDRNDAIQYRDQKLLNLMNDIIKRQVQYFNCCLHDFIDALPQGAECPRGSEEQAFIYRMFMSYEDSLPDIREQIVELPSPLNLVALMSTRDDLIQKFNATKLGHHWSNCLTCNNGLRNFSYYFMHHRKDFSEDEELGFFYMLDKICIIDDILKGNADKYWMDVQYPDDWLPNELEGTTSLSPSRQRIISKLLDYVTKGDWKAPASVGGIQTFIKDVLGVGEPIREPEMQKKSEELWSLLEQGRGDRVVIVMQNLIGYFVSREWLSGGSPALNKAFFGNDDNYSNIDKGNPNRKGTSEKFEYIMPLLDATQIRNLKLH